MLRMIFACLWLLESYNALDLQKSSRPVPLQWAATSQPDQAAQNTIQPDPECLQGRDLHNPSKQP